MEIYFKKNLLEKFIAHFVYFAANIIDVQSNQYITRSIKEYAEISIRRSSKHC